MTDNATPPTQEQLLRWLDGLAKDWSAFGLGQSCKEAAAEIRRMQADLDVVSGLVSAHDVAELYRALMGFSVRTATTYPGKTETLAEAVEWMKQNSIKEIALKQAEIDRQSDRALKAETEREHMRNRVYALERERDSWRDKYRDLWERHERGQP